MLQLLIYPVTDFSRRHPSRGLFADGFLLTDSEMDWFETNYLGPESRNPSANSARDGCRRLKSVTG